MTGHSLESYLAVLYCGAVCFSNFFKFQFVNLSVLDLALSGEKGLNEDNINENRMHW